MTDGVRRTWDGLEIAADEPHGATVVVRRPGAAGGTEVLLLHRAERGPDFRGDWAWTAPSGCRQPGESVYAGASRELAEEAGLTGLPVWAVDATRGAGSSGEHGRWALFAADAADGIRVELVDPEHDRHEWIMIDQVAGLVRPDIVAEGIVKAAAVPFASLAFRQMVEEDLPLVARWQHAAHVAEWFPGDRSEPAVRDRLLPRLRGDVPVRMWVVEVDGRAVGWLQDYRLADRPDYAAKAADSDGVGFDYAIGEPSLLDRGLGTRTVWEFCRDVLHRDYPGAPRFVASPSHRNRRSIRVLKKCGFTAGLWIDPPAGPREQPDTEVVCSLDVAHWLGPPPGNPGPAPA
jgi:RimJ/RimL family protein N-acetyltransferase